MKTKQITLTIPIIQRATIWRCFWTVVVSAILQAIAEGVGERIGYPMQTGFICGIVFSCAIRAIWE